MDEAVKPHPLYRKNTKMNFETLVQRRYSVRAYQQVLPSDAEIKAVLDAARLAPSACNRQPWHFYVVRSQSAREALSAAYPRPWFSTAPLYIAITIHHDEEWVRTSDGHRHGIVDASIAAEHICLAATAAGLGTCWVCAFDVEAARKALPLSSDEEPVIILPIGYPEEGAAVPEKNRKTLAEIVTEI